MGLEFGIDRSGFHFNITKAAAVSRNDDPTKVAKGNRFVPVASGEWDYGRELVSSEDFNSMVKAYRSVVYTASKKNATAVASGNIKLYVAKKSKKQKLYLKTRKITKAISNYIYEGTNPIQSLTCVRKAEDLEEVLEHPILELLTNVNPFMNKFELMELTQTFLELTGNSYWYVFRVMGIPKELWVLPAHLMRIVPSKEDFIQGYVYLSPSGMHIPFTPDEIIHFKFPNPSNLYYGWSPLSALANAYNTNESMDKFNVQTLRNNAVPPIVLIAPPDFDVSEAEWKRIKRRWDSTYGGSTNAGKAAWLEGGWDIKQIAITPRELGFLTAKKDLRQEIFIGYDIPMSQITSESVNRANAEAGEYQYAKWGIAPRHMRMQEKLNEKFTPMFDEQLFLMYDNVVPEDKVFVLSERTSNLASGVTIINEEREKLGMEKVEWGDKPIMSSTMVKFGEAPPTPPGMEGMGGAPGEQLKPGEKPKEELKPGEKPKELKPGEKPEKPKKPTPEELAKEEEAKKVISFMEHLDKHITDKIAHYGL